MFLEQPISDAMLDQSVAKEVGLDLSKILTPLRISSMIVLIFQMFLVTCHPSGTCCWV